MIRSLFSTISLLPLLLLVSVTNAQYPPSAWIQAAQEKHCADLVEAEILVVNESRGLVDVFWIKPKTEEMIRVTAEPMKQKGLQVFNTHVDQVFEVHEIPDPTTGECGGSTQTCRRAYFKVEGPLKQDNVFIINRHFQTEKEVRPLMVQAYFGENIESKLRLENESGLEFHIVFVSMDGSRELMSDDGPVKPYSTRAFNSYVGNEFEITEFGDCGFDDTPNCRTVNFKNPGKNPKIIINKEFRAMLGDVDISEE